MAVKLIVHTHEGEIVNMSNFSSMKVTEVIDRDYHALWVYHGGSPTRLMIGTEDTCERFKEQIFRAIKAEVIVMPAPEVGTDKTFVDRYESMRESLVAADEDRDRLKTLARDLALELVDVYKQLRPRIDQSDTDELAWMTDRIAKLEADDAVVGGLSSNERYQALHEAYEETKCQLAECEKQIEKLESEATVAEEVKTKLTSDLADAQRVANSFQTTAQVMEDKVKFLRARQEGGSDDDHIAALESDLEKAQRNLRETLERNQEMAKARDHALAQLATLRSSPDKKRVVTQDEYENMCLRSEELQAENDEHRKIVHKLRLELKRAYTNVDELIDAREKAYHSLSRATQERDKLKRKLALTGTHSPEDTA